LFLGIGVHVFISMMSNNINQTRSISLFAQ